MEFKIDPETYLRLAAVANALSADNPNQVLRSVRIEHRAGKVIAVASNAKFICGELLGECMDEGAVNVSVDPALQDIAKAELAASGLIAVTVAPGWTVARGIETNRMFPLIAEVAGNWPDWRALVPLEKAKKSNGVIAFYGESVRQISDASPSGVIVFPDVIDITQPVVIRDKTDPNWFGLYLLTDKAGTQTFKPATVPDWLK